jgi:hypothetical protein
MPDGYRSDNRLSGVADFACWKLMSGLIRFASPKL